MNEERAKDISSNGNENCPSGPTPENGNKSSVTDTANQNGRNVSYITAVLSLPREENLDSLQSKKASSISNASNSVNTDINSRKSLRKQWENVCEKWGMTVVRELIYVQEAFWDEGGDDECLAGNLPIVSTEDEEQCETSRDADEFLELFNLDDNGKNADITENQNKSDTNVVITSSRQDLEERRTGHETLYRVIGKKTIEGDSKGKHKISESLVKLKLEDGFAKKVKDQIVISKIHPTTSALNGCTAERSLSPAYVAHLKEGDVIHSIYGTTNPHLNLLFGIMRDSRTFQITVKRMETDNELQQRMNNDSGNINDKVPDKNGCNARQLAQLNVDNKEEYKKNDSNQKGSNFHAVELKEISNQRKDYESDEYSMFGSEGNNDDRNKLISGKLLTSKEMLVQNELSFYENSSCDIETNRKSVSKEDKDRPTMLSENQYASSNQINNILDSGVGVEKVQLSNRIHCEGDIGINSSMLADSIGDNTDSASSRALKWNSDNEIHGDKFLNGDMNKEISQQDNETKKFAIEKLNTRHRHISNLGSVSEINEMNMNSSHDSKKENGDKRSKEKYKRNITPKTTKQNSQRENIDSSICGNIHHADFVSSDYMAGKQSYEFQVGNETVLTSEENVNRNREENAMDNDSTRSTAKDQLHSSAPSKKSSLKEGTIDDTSKTQNIVHSASSNGRNYNIERCTPTSEVASKQFSWSSFPVPYVIEHSKSRNIKYRQIFPEASLPKGLMHHKYRENYFYYLPTGARILENHIVRVIEAFYDDPENPKRLQERNKTTNGIHLQDNIRSALSDAFKTQYDENELFKKIKKQIDKSEEIYEKHSQRKIGDGERIINGNEEVCAARSKIGDRKRTETEESTHATIETPLQSIQSQASKNVEGNHPHILNRFPQAGIDNQKKHNDVLDYLSNDDGADFIVEKTIEKSKIVSATPAAVLQQSVLASGLKVTSTSSKAGLSQIKSTKLKRLWPDSSVFIKRILKWIPPKVSLEKDGNVLFSGCVESSGTRNALDVVPLTFQDSPDIMKKLSPHILEEGMLAVKQEFSLNSNPNGTWTRKPIKMHLRSCIPVDSKSATSTKSSLRTYEFAFDLDKTNKYKPAENLGELFVVYSPSWKRSSCCLGIIGSNDVNSIFLNDQKIFGNDESFDWFKLWICASADQFENTGWLSEADLPRRFPDGSVQMQTMYALNIGTSTDMMRQYEGLKSLGNVRRHLQKTVFCNNSSISDKSQSKSETNSTPTLTKPSSVNAEVWEHLYSTLNPFQLSAIEKIMSGKAKENVALLQGPPGTGKTSTIIGLVSALLNGSSTRYGSKASGTRVQVGRAISNISNNEGLLNAPVSHRILVCAPSNHAVDDLAWKLHNNALGPNGKKGSFNIIRFGMLPGEERHDGRGWVGRQRSVSTFSEARDKYLQAINLDTLIGDIAKGHEVNDFGFRRESQEIEKASRRSRFINFTAERQKILSHCHVVCCTLSGSGSKAFVEAVSRDEFPLSEFDALIIDEACQASEASCLIPFKYNPNIVVLVGDPQQLPVMTLSKEASRCKTDRSLFERLYANGWQFNLLRLQYRMNEDIMHFPSRRFYDGQLLTSEEVKSRKQAFWHKHLCFPRYLLWNTTDGAMIRRNGGVSNIRESRFIGRLMREFSSIYRGERGISIGIVTFYNDQVIRIKDEFRKFKLSNNISIQVSTVDGFQGIEKDIIILSCVRSYSQSKQCKATIGFLDDYRRINVALTRAKQSLWVVGNCKILSSDPLWSALIDDAHKRNLICNPIYFEEMAHRSRGRNNYFIRHQDKPKGRNGKKRIHHNAESNPPPKKLRK